MISSKEAQQIETLWMSDKQGLVSVTMVNQPEQSISNIEREGKRKKLQLTGLALFLELCTCKNRQKQRRKKTQNTCNTERKRKKIVDSINRLSNYQIK